MRIPNNVGISVLGFRAPIIHPGDDIAAFVKNTIPEDLIERGDIIAVTECVVARAQNNYATVDDIAAEVIDKFGPYPKLLLYKPIFSRNRFAMVLRGIARGAVHIDMYLGTQDEVGNPVHEHPVTGINYWELYKSICEEEKASVTLHSSVPVSPRDVIDARLRPVKEGIEEYHTNVKVFRLSDFCTQPTVMHGWNPEFGLLGCNSAGKERIKLFPRDSFSVAQEIQDAYLGFECLPIPEVMIFGDGAYKDPDTGIWEFADPVVSPGYTLGLCGTRDKDCKLKHAAD